MALSVGDPVSCSNTEDYKIYNAEFDWHVDFEHEVIDGVVTLKVKNISKTRNKMKLDTKHLYIDEVSVKGENVIFSMTKCPIEAHGSCLSFPVSNIDDEFIVIVRYSTTKGCTALQWMKPETTEGKKHPYLYSQCQEIHARSLFPCQDSPSIKITFSATVRAREDLNVLMGAIKEKDVMRELGVKVHKFHQKIPIPSYLVAIVCGNLEGRKIGPRSTVWSEPEKVDEAAREFEDTEQFIATGEALCGPYVWGVYDILVLPSTFPYGGMENPCLTYVTPTLLVGDKSLVFVVAHEISHSWTGNLVTNKTWSDFWLNEGHTRYVERLIMEKYHGGSEPMRHMLVLTGLAELKESLDNFGDNHPYNQMVPNMVGMDPDDVFSRVPYEKGSNLLFHLETVCGKDKMLRWLKAYIDKFKYTSLSTEEWKAFLYEYMTTKEHVSRDKLDAVDWKEWFYGRSDIPVKQPLDGRLTDECEKLVERWNILNSVSLEEEHSLVKQYDDMMACQRYYLLQVFNNIKEVTLTHEQLKLIGRLYRYTSASNSQILFGWSLLVIRGRYEPAVEQVFSFLNSQGRLMYTVPIYKALHAWSAMKTRTEENFRRMKDQMHPITAERLRKTLSMVD